MKYNQLPGTDIKLSLICLGTMTWGQQNTEQEAHEQLDYAVDCGVNFIDTAEIYSVPMNPNTQGSTEKIIGNWLVNQKREDLFIATKAAGPGPKHIRNGPNFSATHLTQALHDSLQRLQTDYVDLYQLHWPERPTNFFGKLGYQHTSDDAVTDFKATLITLKGFVDAGKVRYIGISNETPWGTMQYLNIAKEFGLPCIKTIQNPYSLVNRTFEIGLSEMCHKEQLGLLAYSPLGGGILSGKYLNNQQPKNARYTLFTNYFERYKNPNTQKATQAYVNLAKENNLDPAQMALAFVNQQDFVTANIIGATTMQQLKSNIQSADIVLSDDVMQCINQIHLQYPNPAP